MQPLGDRPASGLGAALAQPTVTAEHIPDEPAETGEAMTQRTPGQMYAHYTDPANEDRDEHNRGNDHNNGRPNETSKEGKP